MSNLMTWSIVLSSLRRIRVAWIVGAVQAAAEFVFAAVSALGRFDFFREETHYGGASLEEASKRMIEQAVADTVAAKHRSDWLFGYLAFVLLAGLTYGIYRRSKIAAVVMALVVLFGVLGQLSERSWIGAAVYGALVVVYILAVQAIVRLERACGELGVEPRTVQPKDAMTRRRVLGAVERVRAN